jgi:hypothetical protein
MKKLILLLLFIPLVSFGQSQEVNGISFNGPKNFKKTGNLEWNNGNENIFIVYVEGNAIDKNQYKSTCEKGTRATDFLGFDTLKMNGNDYYICLQEGKNTLAIGSTMIYRNGHTYVITVSANPNDWERVGHIIGYMITRTTMY